MARKRRLRCSCGTRVNLPKGQALPICQHVAPSSIEPAGGWRGPADYFQFFEPRVNILQGKGIWRDNNRHIKDPASPASPGVADGVRWHHHDPDAPGTMDLKMGGIGADETSRAEVIRAGVHKSGVLRGLGPSATKPAKPRLGQIREARRQDTELWKRVERRRAWAAILPHLADATDKQREAYQRHIEGGHTVKAVGELLGISTRAAKDRIAGARIHEQRSRRRERIA